MKRVVVPELLDSDAGTPEEIAGGLADLRTINRRFGGHSTTISMLRKVASRRGLREMHVLDVAGASGDTMREAASALAGEGVKLKPTLLDINPSHLAARDGLSAIVGDATQIPLATKSIDVVSCSLFMHHLEPPQITAFLSEAVRVSRHAVIINDLKRSYTHLLFVKVGLNFFGTRLTKHDGPVSVWRSYTKSEMLQMIRDVHPGEVEIGDHYLFRMGAILWL